MSIKNMQSLRPDTMCEIYHMYPYIIGYKV